MRIRDMDIHMDIERERRIIRAMWGYNGNLEPLCEVEDRGDEIVITLDLPRVKKENVEINTSEDSVEIRAKMNEAVCWERWGSVQRRISFQEFRKQIKLPEPIDPDKASASFKRGILRLSLPKKKRKVFIPIQ